MAGERLPRRLGVVSTGAGPQPRNVDGTMPLPTQISGGPRWWLRAELDGILRALVIPALVRERTADVSPRVPSGRCGSDVAAEPLPQLVELLLAGRPEAARRLVEQVRAASDEPGALFRDLLEPAARALGDLWTDDRVDFTQVTVGVWQLQELARWLEGTIALPPERSDPAGHVLLVPAPGEQHSFGLFLVGAAFRRAGWTVQSGVAAAPADLGRLVSASWFDVVGLSLGSTRGLDRLRASIEELRRSSCNPAVGVLVGGPAFAEAPALAREIGADATAADGAEAVRRASAFSRSTSHRQ